MPDSEANEPSNADLEARIDQLEATIQKMMPTRRGVLTGLAGAGIGGAAVYGATDPARAQAAGLQGTEAEPNDMWAWNLNVANQVTSDLAMGGNDVTGVGAMDVERIVNDYLFAGAFDGSTADERLDNALSVVKDGMTIYLEDDQYETNRTINNKIRFVGTGGGAITSAIGQDTTWTLANRITLVNIRGNPGSELIVDDVVCSYSNSVAGSLTIQVNSDRFRAVNIDDGEITFASGTSEGIVDASTRTTVTDNGTNAVGDIA